MVEKRSIRHRVAVEESGERLDRFLVCLYNDVSRSELQRWIVQTSSERGGVWVNGSPSRCGYRLRVGDEILVQPVPPEPNELLPEAIPLTLLYEDSHLVVVNKPRGMVVHPAPGALHGTLVQAMLAHTQELSHGSGEERPGIVHRLDKDTSGLMVVAKTDWAHQQLQQQIQSRQMERRYLALVWGSPSFETAIVDAPIGRHPGDRKKMAVISEPRHRAREARTELWVRRRYGALFTLLEAKLHTGRTHQIRVHCAYIHHPVVGDPLYGGERGLPERELREPQRRALLRSLEVLEGQALHAYSLTFIHPINGERMAFKVSPPEPMASLLKILDEIYGEEERAADDA